MRDGLHRRAFLAQALALAARGEEDPAGKQLAALLRAEREALGRQWAELGAAVRTRPQQEERNRAVRRELRQALGVTLERRPPAVRGLGVLTRAGYRVERLQFESQPGVWVPAHLYLPEGAGPFPAVLAPGGAGAASRLEPERQRGFRSLARAGVAVLSYDPPGVDDRSLDGVTAAETREALSNALLLLGDSWAGAQVADGRAALDCLQARAEIDRRRLACAGYPGAGPVALHLACADARVRFTVVPFAAEEEPALPGAARLGLLAGELAAALAPRPLLSVGPPADEEYGRFTAQIRASYEWLGVPAHYETAAAPAGSYWAAAARWLCANLRAPGQPDPDAEPGEPQPALSARGEANGDLGFALRTRAAALDQRRKAPAGPEELRLAREAVRARLPELLRLPPPGGSPRFRLERKHQVGTVEIQEGHLTNEMGLHLRAVRYRSPRTDHSATVEILVSGRPHQAGDAEALRLAQRGNPILALDARGIAAGGPGDTLLANLAWANGRELFGLRVADVLLALRSALGGRPNSAILRGTGPGGLWVLCAAILEPRVERVVSHGSLATYLSLLEARRPALGAESLAAGVFAEMDIPQWAGALAPREVALLNPVDGSGRALTQRQTEKAYLFTRQAFAAAGAGARLRLCADGACTD